MSGITKSGIAYFKAYLVALLILWRNCQKKYNIIMFSKFISVSKLIHLKHVCTGRDFTGSPTKVNTNRPND